MTLKTPDLWTPIALWPRPQGSYLHLTLYLVHILKWGDRGGDFMFLNYSSSLQERALHSWGPCQHSPLDLVLCKPQSVFGFHGIRSSTRLCPVSLPPGESQMTSRRPSICPQAPKAWIFTPGNIIKVLLYKMSMTILISWIKFFSRLYCFREFRLKEITVLYFQNTVLPNLAPMLSLDYSNLLIYCPNTRLQMNK